MELSELKHYIDSAIDSCQRIIENKPIVVCSEADLERLLANCITRLICEESNNSQEPEFSVHTQISHYIDGKKHPDIRPDILLLKEKELIKAIDNYIPRKNEKYEGPSIAIELKYLHVGDGISVVEHDFTKWESKLDDNTWLYVVVLLDVPCNPRNRNYYADKEAKIYQLRDAMRENFPDDYNRIHSKVLKKTIDKI